MATQTLTITGDGAVRTGWDAEGYDYTRLQSDDDGTSVIYSPSIDNIVSFALLDTSGLSGAAINSVKVYVKMATLAAYDGHIALGVRLSGTNYQGSEITHNGTTYTLYSTTWTTNPATSSAWTASEIDGMEPFIYKTTNGDGVRVTYLYVEVDYTAGSGVTVTPSAITGTVTSPGVTIKIPVTVNVGSGELLFNSPQAEVIENSLFEATANSLLFYSPSVLVIAYPTQWINQTQIETGWMQESVSSGTWNNDSTIQTGWSVDR